MTETLTDEELDVWDADALALATRRGFSREIALQGRVSRLIAEVRKLREERLSAPWWA